MKTIHDDKSRQELFNKPQHNDNYLPSTSTDYESSDNILYGMSDGRIKIFPNFCISETELDGKGTIRIYYSRGTIVIKGRNLEELVNRIAAKKIAAIRVTPPNINISENNNSFYIDEITFEEN